MNKSSLRLILIVTLLTGFFSVSDLQAQEKSNAEVTEEAIADLQEEKKENGKTVIMPPQVDAKEAGLAEEKELTLQDLIAQDHQEQLKVYDLDNDGRISEEEWKIANEERPERNGQFNAIDKDEDGQIDSDEAIKFLMQRFSVESTYFGESSENSTEDVIEDGVEENAPSEVRFTLFSFPIGK